MAWDIEFTDEFGAWWDGLTEAEQDSVAADVRVLGEIGPASGRPHVDTVKGSRFPNMKELRVQYAGKPYRILFAFDPRRTALLPIGGNKTGEERWCGEFVPVADRLYAKHLAARNVRNNVMGSKETMARNFKELEARMSPERRARIATVARKKIEQIEFSELREEMKITQAELAEKLKKTQATVSQLESRSDWHLSTLREYIEALGGKIEVSAIFPRRTIRITNLATTAKKATSR